jgi:dTMP kinase
MKLISAKFVTFEGIDGCGKSTLISELAAWLDQAGIPCLQTREPGGTSLGEKIRGLLLDPAHQAMSRQTEVLLYTASRAQLTAEVILPALKRGVWVLADRYIDATLAYQGYGRKLDPEPLRRLQHWATQALMPDHTVLLDCNVDTAVERMSVRNHKPDRIEMEERSFHERVRAGYLELAGSDPKRYIVLDAEKPLPEVIADFRAALRDVIPIL